MKTFVFSKRKHLPLLEEVICMRGDGSYASSMWNVEYGGGI